MVGQIRNRIFFFFLIAESTIPDVICDIGQNKRAPGAIKKEASSSNSGLCDRGQNKRVPGAIKKKDVNKQNDSKDKKDNKNDNKIDDKNEKACKKGNSLQVSTKYLNFKRGIIIK